MSSPSPLPAGHTDGSDGSASPASIVHLSSTTEGHSRGHDNDDESESNDAESKGTDAEAQLSAMVRGEDENWFDAIQRKEEEERRRLEEEENARRREQEKRDRDARDEELRQRRKEEESRRRELQEKREKRLAERREQSDRSLEDLERQREAERQLILQQAGINLSTDVASKASQERSARKARIAELVSRVKSASISDSHDVVPEAQPVSG